MVRHHLIVQQALRDEMLKPFLTRMSEDGFQVDDFRTNGLLLPCLPSLSRKTGLPLHWGPHPRYNAKVIQELHLIRVSAESMRADSHGRRQAFDALRSLQGKLRATLTCGPALPVRRVSLIGATAAQQVRVVDDLFASEQI
jgi:A nuclease family of the HNH/ENDO VII superfamily with conserved AHH